MLLNLISLLTLGILKLKPFSNITGESKIRIINGQAFISPYCLFLINNPITATTHIQ